MSKDFANDDDLIAMEAAIEEITFMTPGGPSATYREGFEDGWLKALAYANFRNLVAERDRLRRTNYRLRTRANP